LRKEAVLNLFITTIQHLLTTYGSWALSIFLFMTIENVGIPVAGEPILLVAATTAGSTHTLSAFLFMSFVALAGSVVGSSVGFWIGRVGGFRLLYRYGHLIRLNESKLKVGLYLFQQYGERVALFGRCLPLLRAYAPFLAGTYQMSWLSFIIANTLGTSIVIAIYGGGGYVLGHAMQGFTGIITVISLLVVLILIALLFLLLRRHQHQLEEEAEQLFPGPLKEYHIENRGETPLKKDDTHKRNLMMQAHDQTIPEQVIERAQRDAF
jgi:membrane protein DedA with SNARE-associated domain